MERMQYNDFAATRDDKGLRVIDVREQDEWDEVHVRDAELLPLSKLRAGELPADDGRPLALICRSGGRSAVAAQMLEANGFSNVINVEGGTSAAIAAGVESDLVRGT